MSPHPRSLIEYRSVPKAPGPRRTLGRDALVVGVACLTLAVVGLVAVALSSATSDFDADAALFAGYAGTMAAFALGFVGICLAVVNLYDHAGKDLRSRVALALLVSGVLCSAVSLGILHFRGLLD